MADSGSFSIEQLRSFKRSPNPFDIVKGHFPWMPDHCLIRLGGCYSTDWCRVSICNRPVLELRKDDADLTTVSFVVKNEEGQLLAEMIENGLSVDRAIIHDLEIAASANRIKVWSAHRAIGFELHYSRCSIADIEKYITNDTPTLPDFVGPPEVIENVDGFYRELSQTDSVMTVAGIGQRRNDPTGTFIRWHAARKLDPKDGKIPFFDFISCSLWEAGKHVELRNGTMKSGGMTLQFCAGNTFNF